MVLPLHSGSFQSMTVMHLARCKPHLLCQQYFARYFERWTVDVLPRQQQLHHHRHEKQQQQQQQFQQKPSVAICKSYWLVVNGLNVCYRKHVFTSYDYRTACSRHLIATASHSSSSASLNFKSTFAVYDRNFVRWILHFEFFLFNVVVPFNFQHLTRAFDSSTDRSLLV